MLSPLCSVKMGNQRTDIINKAPGEEYVEKEQKEGNKSFTGGKEKERQCEGKATTAADEKTRKRLPGCETSV